jgi:hypothetical protein
MIEELSKMHLVIPVNLRGSYETTLSLSCPAAGWQWFKIFRAILRQGTTSQQEACVHAVAYLRGVFKEASQLTITELRKPFPEGMDCHNQIVDLFSKNMSEGMSWESHGDKRLSFYDEVHSGASQVR